MIKAAGQSRATYGAAVDPFSVAQINTLRGKYTQALWPKKQIEEGIHPDTAEYWEELNVQTGNVRGPVNYFRRT
eukprot:245462-Heterocapsa_arctica.AAC.1